MSKRAHVLFLCVVVGGCSGTIAVGDEAAEHAGGSAEGGRGGSEASRSAGAGGAPDLAGGDSGGASGNARAGAGAPAAGGAAGAMTLRLDAGVAADASPPPVAATTGCVSPACDDFEAYAAGARPGGPWGNFEVSATGGLSVDDTKAYSGKQSVKITMSPGGDLRARMRHAATGLVPADEIYLRMMVWVDHPITGTDLHWNFMRVEGGGSYIVAGGDSANRAWQHGVMQGRDCWARGKAQVPVGAWTCYEFHSNAATKDVQTFVNGVLDTVTEIKNGNPSTTNAGCLSGGNGNWPIPRAEQVKFGFTGYHTLGAPATMWIDDVVVSNKRIGCPTP